MSGRRFPHNQDNHFYLIFTDLDGTLLDHNTYDWKNALPALEKCEQMGIPIIISSSKTKAEIIPICRKIRITHPFIAENGGGIYFARQYFNILPPASIPEGEYWKVSLGVDYETLVNDLSAIRNELGWKIKGFSDMNVKEISQLTGLDYQASVLAKQREYDEPFIIEDEPVDTNPLFKAAKKRGLSCFQGGRFYHLQGKNDKGRAMNKVISWYQESHRGVISIALGDSPNDFPMLINADYPVLIRSKRSFPALKKEIPQLNITKDMGPMGWNSAVFNLLLKKEDLHNG